MNDIEADQAAAAEDDRASQIREANGNENNVETVQECAVDQCPWCGFRDHTCKTRSRFPQYRSYSDTAYEKDVKVSPDWVPGNRQSHMRRRRSPITPYSVVSAPSDSEFKPKSGQKALTPSRGLHPKLV